MSVRWAVVLALVSSVLAGCAPGATAPPPPAPAAAPDTVILTEPVPPRVVPAVRVPRSYQQAVLRRTRSTTGAPGESYWQNSVSYRIEAELDPGTARVRGYQRIVYRNRSPATLPSLVLNLYQNIHSPGVPRNRQVQVTGGVTLLRMAAAGAELERRPTNQIPIEGDDPFAPAGYAVRGTLARVQLPRALAPGDSVALEAEWEYAVPPAPTFRTGWEETLGSRVFQVAQWYPQVAVYDDLVGWATTPYLGDGEFYLEVADFEVQLTVPAGYLVAATGELANPDEVLTDEARARLAAAATADSITHIVTAADLTADNATQTAPGGQLTWRFTARDVRDFAFATSAGYVWDAVRLRRPDPAGPPGTVLVHALYRPAAPNWERAAEFTRHSLGWIENYLTPYIHTQLTAAEGPIGGMEYPMLMFIGKPAAAEALYRVLAHEAAHQWFPMLVGSDEAAYAWLDEGLATFLENRAAGDFFDDPDSFAAERNAYLGVAGLDTEVPMMRHTDLVTPYGARTVAAYAKPTLLFRSLEWVLGTEPFRHALEGFTSEWHLRRTTPWDLFATFERYAGQPLGWFFGPWWFDTGVLDQRIVEAAGTQTGGATVTIEDRGEIPAPAIVVGTTAAGERVIEIVPVEHWLGGARRATVRLGASAPIVRIELDPDRVFPALEGPGRVWEVEPSR